MSYSRQAGMVAVSILCMLGAVTWQQPAAFGADQRVGVQPVAALPAGLEYVQQQQLTAFHGVSPDVFGYTVALSANGKVALVGANGKGAPDSTNPIGAVYVFTTNGSNWSLQQELADPNGMRGDSFGGSLALSPDGSIAVVAAPGAVL